MNNLGDDQDVTLTHVHDTGIQLNSSRQLQFRDSDLKVHSSADGQLDIDANTEVEINTATVDITASSGVDFNASTIADFSAATVSITGTTTLSQANHNGKVLICNSASDIDLDITANSISAGFNCLIVQIGAGEVTIDGSASGVTVNNRNSHTKTANQWAIMTLLCIDATADANVFVSSGDGAS